MKGKLRHITVNNKQFFYHVRQKYISADDGLIVLKVFLDGHKLTPLVIEFHPIINPPTGNPLFQGTHLFNISTQQQEYVNLNSPVYVKDCIIYALTNGWTGENSLKKLDGIAILRSLGFDTTSIVSKKITVV